MSQTDVNTQALVGTRIGVRAVAGVFALCAFAVALVNGLISGGATDWVLGRGMVAMAGAFIAGLFIGTAAQVGVRERLVQMVTPEPTEPAEAGELTDGETGARGG